MPKGLEQRPFHKFRETLGLFLPTRTGSISSSLRRTIYPERALKHSVREMF